MFKFARVFLLFQILVQPLRGAELSSPEIRNAPAAAQLHNEILVDLVKDIRAKLGESFEWPPSRNALCPSGFTYLPSAGSCYKVVYESHDWYSAGRRCQAFGPGSRLTTVTSATENQALKTFLASELSRNVYKNACIPVEYPNIGELFWTSGQRALENNCESKFVWKPSSSERLPFVFTSWTAGEPNCGFTGESCVHFWPQQNFDWNDLECNKKICPLCEYKP